MRIFETGEYALVSNLHLSILLCFHRIQNISETMF